MSNFNDGQITMAEVVDTATDALNNQAVALKNLSALEAKYALAGFDTSSLTFMNTSDANLLLGGITGESTFDEVFGKEGLTGNFISSYNKITDIMEDLFDTSKYTKLNDDQKLELKSTVLLAAAEYEKTISKLANDAVE